MKTIVLCVLVFLGLVYLPELLSSISVEAILLVAVVIITLNIAYLGKRAAEGHKDG